MGNKVASHQTWRDTGPLKVMSLFSNQKLIENVQSNTAQALNQNACEWMRYCTSQRHCQQTCHCNKKARMRQERVCVGSLQRSSISCGAVLLNLHKKAKSVSETSRTQLRRRPLLWANFPDFRSSKPSSSNLSTWSLASEAACSLANPGPT